MTHGELEDAVLVLQFQLTTLKQDVALLKSDRAKLLWSCVGLIATAIVDYVVRVITHA